MKLLKSLWGFFHDEPETVSRPAHIKRSGRQERSLAHVVTHGEITLADIGGNHPAKVVLRLRKLGYVMPKGSQGGERWDTNPRTGCDYKVYIWTGKIPEKWMTSKDFYFVPLQPTERRSKPRGGRR